MTTSATENYLKAVLNLTLTAGAEERVSLGRVAESLSVTASTVTNMMKALAGQGLVDYQARQGVALTPQGRKVAVAVLRRHRLIETFLVNIMHLDWSEVHEEAEALEHVVSDRLIDRMDEMLGFPDRDPHGDPIPTRDGGLPATKTIPLAESAPGHYRLARISEDAAGFLEWLKEQRLQPGITFELLSINEHADVVSIRLEPEAPPLNISLSAAQKLLVTPAPPPQKRKRIARGKRR
jgi:DtxR family Mn-dependent transcriptional regulator